ncbi:MAG: hypothetical protein WD036_11610 [Bauldia sp.]
MRTLVVPLAGLGLAALACQTASAASPAYCALYAREYANQVVQPGAAPGMQVSVQDQAYYRCLNQDEDPILPARSAYFGTDVDGLGSADAAEPIGVGVADAAEPIGIGVADAAEPIGEGDASEPDVAVAPVDEPAPVKKAPRKARSGGGTLVAWSPEWVAKCNQYYPHSFDPKDGTVLPYNAAKRRLCPY